MRFVITLTDTEFETLSDRSKHLTETLIMRRQADDIEVIIQREGVDDQFADEETHCPTPDNLFLKEESDD